MAEQVSQNSLSLVFILALASSAMAENTLPEGRDLFLRYCAICHGRDARGGEGGTTTPAPNLTKIAERRGSVWPMLEIMSIVDGYTKATEPRPEMPVIPELTEGMRIEFDTGNGNVVMVPANLVSVVQYLESLQVPKPKRYVP